MIVSGTANSVDELRQKLAGLNLDKGDTFSFTFEYEYIEPYKIIMVGEQSPIPQIKTELIKRDIAEKLSKYNAKVDVTSKIVSTTKISAVQYKTVVQVIVNGEVDIAPAVIVAIIIIAVIGAYLITANLKQIYYYIAYNKYAEAKQKGIVINPPNSPSSPSDLTTSIVSLIPLAVLGLLILEGEKK